MAEADGKLFELLADEPCRELLLIFVRESTPLTQRQLATLLENKFNGSTISRRMADLEEYGLVKRRTPHSPYELLFPEQMGNLLEQGFDLVRDAKQRQADLAALHAEELRGRLRGSPTIPPEERAT
jgi:DNA-binding IclR family transcriptional regulator